MNKTWTKEQIIYMASMIDGEGSICIEIQSQSERHNRKVDYYSLRLVIINTNKDLMDWLQKYFDGNVSPRKKVPGRKLCYRWNIFSHNSASILKECLPYMIIKKRHAEIFIEFESTMSRSHWKVSEDLLEKRRQLYLKLKKLNKVG